MRRNEYSRREFLKTFAMLSSASLIVGLTSGCAVYGPPPANYTHPEVTEIYYIDSLSNKILLQNNQNVPVQTVCRIDFSKAMNIAVPVTISFADSTGNAVLISQSWLNDLTLVVTPTSQLLLNTTHTLSIEDAEDIYGNKLSLTADAAATFHTVSA